MSLPALNETLGNSLFGYHALRSDIQSTLAAGEPVDSVTHAEFEAALAQAIYEIRPHVVGGPHAELRKLWSEYNVEYVIDFEARTTVQQANGKVDNEFGIPASGQTRHIQRVDIGSLLDVSRLLDRITKKLGLMPETTGSGRPGGRLS